MEETLDLTGIKDSPVADTPPADTEPLVARNIDVEVNGQRYSVRMWVPEAAPAAVASGPGGTKRPKRAAASKSGGSGGSGDVIVPMQGTIVKVMVAAGDTVEAGDPIVVLEAMKMENNVCAEKSGTVTEIKVAEGDSVGGGDVVAVIE